MVIGFQIKSPLIYPFKNIRWSTKHTLSDLTNNISKNGNSVNFCKKLRDIDIIDDYCDYKDRFNKPLRRIFNYNLEGGII